MHNYTEFNNSFLGPSQPSSFRLLADGGKENQDRIAILPLPYCILLIYNPNTGSI
jgi:hypothetical protein